MDIKQAYRNVPVAPEDRHLLGLMWDNKIHIDQVLPFGLCSAPLIFSAVADALLWIIKQSGTSWAIHYIENFLTMGSSYAAECNENHDYNLRMGNLPVEPSKSDYLPVEPSKSVGPTSLTFLGIEMDSIDNSLRLPPEKLAELKEQLSHWRDFKACKKGTSCP